jgi:hypothetical protein
MTTMPFSFVSSNFLDDSTVYTFFSVNDDYFSFQLSFMGTFAGDPHWPVFISFALGGLHRGLSFNQSRYIGIMLLSKLYYPETIYKTCVTCQKSLKPSPA